MRYSLHFNKEVCFNSSLVQTPYSVLQTDSSQKRWSKHFDKQFIKNVQKDPSLKWQYFGSTEGYLRIYPGFDWTVKWPNGEPNIYDCRNQMWYTQAISCPHRTVVLLDNSGSMHGLRMTIAQRLIASLLDLLGDNDFFNIFAFSTTPEYIVAEFNDTLVRALPRNKQMVIDNLEKIDPRNISDFDAGIRAAVSLLKKFNAKNIDSSCNCAVVIVTDALTRSFLRVFEEEFDKQQVQARVFTYMVGREQSYEGALKELACQYNGYFKKIESKNNIDSKILDYTNVFNRPLSNLEDSRFVWTKAYYQKAFDNEGLGMVISVSSAVYDKKHHDTGVIRKNLLGVVGTDVSVDELLSVMEIDKLDVNAYIFMVTDIGLTVLHPRLTTTFFDQSIGSYTTKPGYNSVDITLLELNDDILEIRKDMIHRVTGSRLKTKVRIPIANWKRLLILEGTIYYKPVPNGSFSVALFLPNRYGHKKVKFDDEFVAKQYSPEYNEKNCEHVESNNDSNFRQKAICTLIQNDTDYQLATDWSYCRLNSSFLLQEASISFRDISNKDLLQRKFKSSNPENFECDETLLNKVLFDIYQTATLMTPWYEFSQSNKSKSFFSTGIEMTFVMTSSGMTRKFWHNSKKTNKDELACRQKQEQIFKFQKRKFPDLYRRVAEVPNDSWIYTFTLDESDSNELCKQKTSITAARAVRINDLVFAVVGYTRSYKEFAKHFQEIAEYLSDDLINGCYSNKHKKCYIIDENGYIIVSKDQSDVQKFFGSVDGLVMKKLEKAGLFTKYSVTNYDKFCAKEDDVKAMASKFVPSPQLQFISTILTTSFCLLWYPKKLTWFLVNLIAYLLWAILFTSQPTYTYARLRTQLEPCYIRHEIYVANRSKSYYNDVVVECCGTISCSKSVNAIHLSNSNLYLVIIQPVKPLNGEYSDINRPCIKENNFDVTPQRLKISESDICKLYGDCEETKGSYSQTSCPSSVFKSSENSYYCSDDGDRKNSAISYFKNPLKSIFYLLSTHYLSYNLFT